MPLPDSSPLDRDDLRARVDTALRDFLALRATELAGISTDLSSVSAAIDDFVLNTGKRLRPGFAYWGWRAAGGNGDDAAVVRAVSALELVQACALMHDDVMDGSATRRGAPSMHERFAAEHRDRGWQGAAAGFGQAAAILLGDLALIWADEMLRWAGLSEPALTRIRPAYDEMRTEVMAGQFLDVIAAAQPTITIERALTVARYKSAKYTVERPLHIGGLLHGCSPAVLAAYSSYGLPLGEAFQLRDDLLGVFGDPDVTGKPAGDDLREGKRTALIALALERATTAQSAHIHRLLGDPMLDDDGVACLREIFADTGAAARIEEMIEARTTKALAALHPDRAPGLEPDAVMVLAALANVATTRHT